jgi:hypothetical protein
LRWRLATVTYGDDYAEEFRQAAGYLDRILKGARPQRCLLHCISLVVADIVAKVF